MSCKMEIKEACEAIHNVSTRSQETLFSCSPQPVRAVCATPGGADRLDSSDASCPVICIRSFPNCNLYNYCTHSLKCHTLAIVVQIYSRFPPSYTRQKNSGSALGLLENHEMDHPLAGASSTGSERSLERNVEREERNEPARFDDHALFGGNWADTSVGTFRTSHIDTDHRIKPVKQNSYDSRLQTMLDDDHDVGQDRNDGFGTFHGTQELVDIRPSSREENSDYFGDSNGFATPGRDDFGEFQGGLSTPVSVPT
jgi:hypothetical protein